MPEKNELEEEKVFDLSAAQNIKDPRIESHINLEGYTYLTSEAAKVLSSMKINYLSLYSITNWEDGCAQEIANFRGAALFLGLSELSASDASFLSNHKCVLLHFSRLAKLSTEAAESLATECCGRFHFDKLDSISESESHLKLVTALAHGQYGIHMPKVAFLTPEFANAMSATKKQVILGIKSLDSECASMIAKCQGFLEFDMLYQITPDVAKALSRHRGETMKIGLEKMPLEVAELLSRYLGSSLSIGRGGLYDCFDDFDRDFSCNINGRLLNNPDEQQKLEIIQEIIEFYSTNSPSMEAVRAICQFQGNVLNLDVVKYVSEEIAKVLSRFSGNRLSLGEIKYIDSAAAKLLSKYKGRLEASQLPSFSEIPVPKELKSFIKKCAKRF